MATSLLHADEGMWTLDNLPLKALKEKHSFEPDNAWLEHLRLSTLSLGGSTGSFISGDGLVLTNHHCVRGGVARLSSAARDLLKNGFVANTHDEELKMAGATYKMLMAMENISERLRDVVGKEPSESKANEMRVMETERLKEELEKKTGLSYQAVQLYQGGETWLYGYREFKDVRLVMAPEQRVASFGGDYDNFTYPRHCMDFALVRLYENGHPYHPAKHLRLASEPLKNGDLTFVAGHPGRTSRMQTLAQMKYDRDAGLPSSLAANYKQREILQEYAKRGTEEARQVQAAILSINNSIKANEGYLAGLQNEAALQRIAAAEKALQKAVAGNMKLQSSVSESWEKIEKALLIQRGLLKENIHVGDCRSERLRQALTLVRLIQQTELPAGKRLLEYRSDVAIKAFRERLEKVVPAPSVEKEQEILVLTRNLEGASKSLGAKHPFVKATLGRKKAEEVARLALEKTSIDDAAFRRKLISGGNEALRACEDPMIRLAQSMETPLLSLKARQDSVRAMLDEHGARIARARFTLQGKSQPPDATSTLRISYGPVATYPANGTLIQPFTTFAGLIDRHAGWGGNEAKAMNGEWTLPQSWVAALDKLDLRTPMNFSHDVDTIGGNSGSPVVNRKGELVGVLFDGNIESLAGRYYFDGKANRSVSVDIRAILESLEKVYGAGRLVKEIRGQ